MRRVGWVVLVVGLTVGAWFALRDTPPEALTDDRPSQDAAEPQKAGALLMSPETAVALRARIQGVVTQGGTPVAASIEVFRARKAEHVPVQWWIHDYHAANSIGGHRPGARVGSAKSDEDGAFTVSVPGAGLYEVRARMPASGTGTALASVATDTTTAFVTVAVPGGASSIFGRAQFHDGRPFTGSIRAVLLGNSPGQWGMHRTVSSTRSDSTGAFTLQGVPVGALRVDAVEPGVWTCGKYPVRVPQIKPLVIIVDVSKNRLRGRVVDDETSKPIAGARVSLMNSTVITDNTGAFETGRTMDYIFGVVRANGYPKKYFDQSTGNDIVIRLPRGVTVQGTVRAEDGRPIEGVPVIGHKVPYDLGFHFVFARDVSDAQGKYSLTMLPAGELTVVALGNGWISSHVGDYDAKVAQAPAYNPPKPQAFSAVGGETIERDLLVVRAGRIEAVVVDHLGAPVSGAQVTSSAPGSRMASSTPHRYLLPATSDADGRVVFDTAPSGSGYRLQAMHPNHGKALSAPFSIANGETTTESVAFVPPRLLTVQVAEGDGAPIAMARVVLGEQATKTNKHGIAELRTTSEEAEWISVHKTGYLDHSATAPREGRVDVTLDRAVLVNGTVINPGGSVAHATIQVIDRPEDVSGDRVLAQTAADDNGKFRVPLPLTKTVLLQATVRHQGTSFLGTLRVRGDMLGGDGVAIHLLSNDAGGRPQTPVAAREVAVRVVGPDTKPIRSATVAVKRPSKHGPTLAIGSESVVLPIHGPDPFWISIHDARDSTGARCAACFEGSFDDSVSEVVIHLKTAQTISGHVVDGRDQPIAGVPITAEVLPPADFGGNRSWAGSHGVTRTRADGSFRLEGLSDRDYELSFFPPKGLQAPVARAFRGGTKDVRLIVTQLADATIHVLDPTGRPVKGAFVHVDPVGRKWPVAAVGRTPSTYTNASGHALLTALDPNLTYVLQVRVNGRDDVARNVKIKAWTVADTTVRLQERFTITGFVRDASGAGVPGARIWGQLADGTWRQTQSAQDGNFVLRDMPAGSVSVTCSMFSLASSERGELPTKNLAAGAEGVILRIDPGNVVLLTVRNWGDEDDALVRLSKNGQAGRRHAPRMAKTGTRLFAGLDADTVYTIVVGPTADHRVAHFRGTIPTDGKIDLELIPGGTVQGTVAWPTGTRPQHPRIELIGPAVFIVGTATPTGYRVDGVPPGEYTLRVMGNGESRTETVRAGDVRDIDLSR